MPIIHLITEINAPIERCFDLSRSIDLHLLSTSQTNEKAIAGVTKGLIGPDQEVTWRARHFGIYQNLTSRITAYDYPNYFESKMQKGAFKKIDHRHVFEQKDGNTIMKDHFDFEAPLGNLGKIVSRLFLFSYMKNLLEVRNRTIKQVAESEQWKLLLSK
jgi:ligand-binding SRPBCC domain-containing protein